MGNKTLEIMEDHLVEIAKTFELKVSFEDKNEKTEEGPYVHWKEVIIEVFVLGHSILRRRLKVPGTEGIGIHS